MNQLTMEEIKLLNEKAKNIRIDILKAITKANSGHTGGSLSIADLLTLLFFHEMNIKLRSARIVTLGERLEDVFVVYSPQLVTPSFAAELEHRIVTVCTI